jgi:hypothetical protein
MAGKAKGRRTFGTKIKDQTHDIKFLYGLQGSTGSPRASNMSFSFAGGSSTPSSTDEYARLKTQGDTMIGAISYFPKVVTIDLSGEIDVNAGYSGQLDDGYSSYLYLTGSTNPDDLVTIANPSHVGQLLHIETVPELVLKHNTGNIFIPDEADRTIEAGGFVTLLYDGAIHSGKWVLVSTSTAGGGASGANTALSNLSSVSVNTTIDMNDQDIEGCAEFEINPNNSIKSSSTSGSGYNIGFHCSGNSGVGTAGQMELPYVSNSTNTPTDFVVNGWFGDDNGSIGIQYYTTSGQTRIWIKANTTWQKAYAT